MVDPETGDHDAEKGHDDSCFVCGDSGGEEHAGV